MATFHENLKQSFKNFKNKYIGNVPSGVTLAQINADLTELNADIKANTFGTKITPTFTPNTWSEWQAPSDGYYIMRTVGAPNSEYANISTDNTVNNLLMGVNGETGLYQCVNTFLRKGMTIYIYSTQGSNSTVLKNEFIPINN
jgi:hypothetical protein